MKTPARSTTTLNSRPATTSSRVAGEQRSLYRKAAPPDSGPYQSPKKSVSPLEVRGRHPASVISGLGAPNANPWA